MIGKPNIREAGGETQPVPLSTSEQRPLRASIFKGAMMIKKVLSAALVCGVLAVVTAATASAQMPGTSLRATIPFDFNVSGKVLPAGEYVIRRITDGPSGLIISNVNVTHDQMMFQTNPVQPNDSPARPEFVFDRYGDSYFLSEVFAGGGETGSKLRTSREEKAMRREMASNRKEPEIVALAAY
jgi:hypothetical protein